MATGTRLFDRLISGTDEKLYDEKMIPIKEAEVKANFQAAKREGEKLKITLQKDFWENMFDVEDLDVNEMADSRLKVEAINAKIKVIEDMYEELFGEKM